MKKIIFISILAFFLFGCSNPKRNLVFVENDSEINLMELDSVRENLNGFWIPKNDLNAAEILWLDFNKTKNSTYWETIPFTEEIQRTKELPLKSCPTIATLIKINGKAHLEFVSLGGTVTIKIDSLTKTKLKIEGNSYLRHKGYEFLKTWNVHGY